MRRAQDRAAGGLVDAMALHAYQPILDQVDPPDAMLCSQLIEHSQQYDGIETRAIDADWHALLEADLNVLGLVGSALGRDRERIHILFRLVPRVFQHAALVRDMPDIAVAAVDRLERRRHWNIMFSCVI